MPSTESKANPHGLAVRFLLDEQASSGTDIVCHASKLFPGSDGQEVLEFFQSLKDGTVDDYIKTHSSAAAFVQEIRPVPKSFAHETFHSINAFQLLNADGRGVFVRYLWIPLAGEENLTAEELGKKGTDFLFSELPGSLEKGPMRFKLVVQIAEEDDVTDDCAKLWPQEREMVEMGVLAIEEMMDEIVAQEKGIVFNPIPGVQGIEASADPILAARSAVYSTSSKVRLASTIQRL
jgi:catalase